MVRPRFADAGWRRAADPGPCAPQRLAHLARRWHKSAAMHRACILLLLTALTVTGCDRRASDGPVVVSTIGGAPHIVPPAQLTTDLPPRLLLAATAQGLVSLDAAGQIEPGLAERWTVLDDGLSYIFRLRDATWSDGRPVTTEQVVTILRRA